MSWEYPYHSGPGRSDRLVPASLYGLKVAVWAEGSQTAAQALVAFDRGKEFMDHISDTDVYAYAILVGQVRQGHLGRALFICPQPECTVAGGHSFLFATIVQWAAQ